jgi:hypothetical protein
VAFPVLTTKDLTKEGLKYPLTARVPSIARPRLTTRNVADVGFKRTEAGPNAFWTPSALVRPWRIGANAAEGGESTPSLARAGPSSSAVVPSAANRLMAGRAVNTELRPTEAGSSAPVLRRPKYARANVIGDWQPVLLLAQAPGTTKHQLTTMSTAGVGLRQTEAGPRVQALRYPTASAVMARYPGRRSDLTDVLGAMVSAVVSPVLTTKDLTKEGPKYPLTARVSSIARPQLTTVSTTGVGLRQTEAGPRVLTLRYPR